MQSSSLVQLTPPSPTAFVKIASLWGSRKSQLLMTCVAPVITSTTPTAVKSRVIGSGMRGAPLNLFSDPTVMNFSGLVRIGDY